MCWLTLPTWGMTRGGELFALPTPALPTNASASSSLPTPKAGDGERGRDLPRLRPDKSGRELATTVGMLPTPTVMDMGRGKTPEEWEAWKVDQRAKHANGNGHGESLEQAALTMLPTPTTQDASNTAGPSQFNRNTPPLNAVVVMLPTPRAQNAENRNQHIWKRPAGQPQNLENALAWLGDATSRPSDAGSPSPDQPLPPPFSDATTDPDSIPRSLNG